MVKVNAADEMSAPIVFFTSKHHLLPSVPGWAGWYEIGCAARPLVNQIFGRQASRHPARGSLWEHRRLARRLKDAKLATRASLEDVLCDPERGIDKASTRQLATCHWVKSKHDVVIVGKAGVGKSYMGSALADAACRAGYRSLFVRVPRLLEVLALARAAGEYASLLGKLSRIDVLVLDDFLLNQMNDVERRDLLEVLEDRYDRTSTVITTQVPTKTWHEALSEPTIADAICDRLVHNAHVLKLGGPSIRKKKALQVEPQTAT